MLALRVKYIHFVIQLFQGNERQKKKVVIIESCERYTELPKLTKELMPRYNVPLHWDDLLLKEALQTAAHCRVRSSVPSKAEGCA